LEIQGDRTMSFQAYLDNVKAKTGKTPEDFAKLASAKGLVKHGEIVKWLKGEHALGHGHATAIAGVVLRMGTTKRSSAERTDALFGGKKGHWRRACDATIAQAQGFGADVEVAIGGSYVSLLRDGKKFAILQPSSSDRLDVGIKLKGAPVEGRFEAAGKWNAMVTHRVRVHAAQEIDSQLLLWLRRAYDLSSSKA
jgi:hypothetical protein